MLFALPVGGVDIWPIGSGIPRGNHGCLPDWVVYLVCRSFSHSEKLCMGPGYTEQVTGYVWHGALAPGAGNVGLTIVMSVEPLMAP